MEICRRLDGIPLALELAAARVGGLPITVIAARLDESFRLLTTGPRDVPQRQQTLQATMAWSWELLSAREQTLLAQLSVFAGGWTVDAAEIIGGNEHSASWEALDVLDGLVNKSLVEMDETGAALRYRLLDTVRQYGLEQLAAMGETVARGRHLRWCLELAQQAAPELMGRRQQAWATRLETDHDNIRAALTWALLEEKDTASGLLLASLLGRFWSMRGHLSEGRSWLRRALAVAPATLPSRRGAALRGAGYLAYRHGDYEEAGTLYRQSMTLARELGDRMATSSALNGLGLVAWSIGDYREATSLLEECLALKREDGDALGVAIAFLNLGNVAKSEGDYQRARVLYEEALTRQRQFDDTFTMAMTVSNLGIVAELLGEYDRAAALYRESLELRRELGDSTGIAQSLGNLGMVVFLQGDVEQGRVLLEETLTVFRELGDLQGITGALGDLGTMASEQGDHEEAVRLHTESLATARRLGNKESIAGALLNLGTAMRRAGNGQQALSLFREGLALAKTIGDKGLVTTGLESASHVLASMGGTERGATILGAAEGLRETLGTLLRGCEHAEHDRLVQTLRATLGESGLLAVLSLGKELSLDDAVAIVMEDGGPATRTSRCR